MSTTVAFSLLEKLKGKQTQEGLSDYKFADKLAISHQLWQMTRTGKRDIGFAVLQGTIRAYRDLIPDVLIFFSGDVDISSIIGDLSTTPSETHQDGKLGRFLRNVGESIKVLLDHRLKRGGRKCQR